MRGVTKERWGMVIGRDMLEKRHSDSKSGEHKALLMRAELLDGSRRQERAGWCLGHSTLEEGNGTGLVREEIYCWLSCK